MPSMPGTISKVMMLIIKLLKTLKFDGNVMLNIGRYTTIAKPFIMPQRVERENDKRKVKRNYPKTMP